MRTILFALVFIASSGPLPVSAQEASTATTALVTSAAPALDSGNTAWLLISTALVLFMMIPGLALFYAGLVRRINVLSVLIQCLALTSVLSIVWLAFGYSAAFSEGGTFIGGLSKAFLKGVTTSSMHTAGGIPELLR